MPSSVDYEKKSKAFGISMDPDIIDEARAKASANDQTLSTYAVEAVKSYLKDIQMDKQSHKAIDARRKESV